jgi:hypothetical protein
MKTPITFVLLMLAFAGAIWAQHPADRFQTTRTRIEALLNQRLKPSSLPEKPANPFDFTQPGTQVLVPGDPIPTQIVSNIPRTDDEILAYAVARLRITGLVLRGGVSHVLINSTTYRDGDLIPVSGSGETVYYIRLKRISDRKVVFEYNDASAEVVLPN